MTASGLPGAVTGGGALVAAAALALAAALTAPAGSTEADRYRATGLFDNVGGLKPGAPVVAGGVRAGEGGGLEHDLDPRAAVVTLFIESRYSRIPADGGARAYRAGLHGERYLEPGGAQERFLRDGDRITLTNSAPIL